MLTSSSNNFKTENLKHSYNLLRLTFSNPARVLLPLALDCKVVSDLSGTIVTLNLWDSLLISIKHHLCSSVIENSSTIYVCVTA